jgi:predicted HicB family RNase H-like nuclease
MAKNVIVKGFPEELHHKAKIRAAQESITLKDLIIKAVAEYLLRAEVKGGGK